MIIRKTAEEIELMKEAGRRTALAREYAGSLVKPGATTGEIDSLVGEFIKDHGGKPSFLNYNGFPGNMCISINDEVVHGIPGERVIQPGDIVSVDVGVYYKGYHGDSAKTFPAGEIGKEAALLIEITRQSFYKGMEQAVPGNRIGDIGHAVQAFVEGYGYAPVRVLTGHGVGKKLHEEPDVLNFGKPHTGDTLKEGMVIAIEPMINQGTHRVNVLDNDWTVVTADGKLSSHYEHTIAITADGPVILTQA